MNHNSRRSPAAHNGNGYRPVLADSSPSIVLIDSSNAFFNWYYGALASFNRKHCRPRGSTVDKEDHVGMDGLRATFEYKCRFQIKSIMALTGVSLRDIVFAYDCPRSKIWRHDLMSKKGMPLVYKASRPTRRDIGIGMMMDFLYNDLLPRIMLNRGVGAPRAEADDVIAVLTRLITHRAPRRRVFIFTDDSDFVQLLDHSSVVIYTQRHRLMREKYTTDPKKFLRMKCFMGDRSDNIDGAFPRCGPKTALSLIEDPELLATKIKKHGVDKLNRNRRLIDFDLIPRHICSKIMEQGLCACGGGGMPSSSDEPESSDEFTDDDLLQDIDPDALAARAASSV